MEIKISPAKIYSLLLMVTAVLVLLSISGQIYIYLFGGRDRWIIQFFNLDIEYNFPTWYQSLILLFSSTLLLFISVNKKKTHDKFFHQWLILSFIFLILSFEELIGIHEQWSGVLTNALHASGFLHFTWILVGLLFLAVFGIFYLRFLVNLSKRFRILFLLAGIIYVIGAIGFEAVGGKIIEIYSETSFIYVMLTNFEETLEMIGVLIFIYALLDYLRINVGVVTLKFTSSLKYPNEEMKQRSTVIPDKV